MSATGAPQAAGLVVEQPGPQGPGARQFRLRARRRTRRSGGMMGMPVPEGQELQRHASTADRLFEAAPFCPIHRFATAVLSTVFSILGPKIMGKATTKLFEGHRRQDERRARSAKSISATSGRFCSCLPRSTSSAPCSATFSNMLWRA